jgi:hypothetical protein
LAGVLDGERERERERENLTYEPSKKTHKDLELELLTTINPYHFCEATPS